MTDVLRASFIVDTAEGFVKIWEGLLASSDFTVVRLKNKLGRRQEPYNFHLNASFKPDALSAPIIVEIQLWVASIMALNDVSHAQYEIARAKDPRAI